MKKLKPEEINSLQAVYSSWFEELQSPFLLWCESAKTGEGQNCLIEKYTLSGTGPIKFELIYQCRGTCWELVLNYNGNCCYCILMTEDGEFTINLYLKNLPKE